MEYYTLETRETNVSFDRIAFACNKKENIWPNNYAADASQCDMSEH